MRPSRILFTVTYSAPDLGALRLVNTLRNALRDGPITITTADLDGILGVTMFADRTIALSDDQDDETWRTTLVHELLHLIRGPVAPDQTQDEEEAIEHATAVLMVPNGAVLAGLQNRWTRQQMCVLAAAHRVDLDTMMTALNPPTMPLHPVAARTLIQDAVELAARVDPET